MQTISSNDVLNVIWKKKRIPWYRKSNRICKEDIDTILHATLLDPSVNHLFPWNFIVISDKKKLQQVVKALGIEKCKVDAGIGIVICLDPAHPSPGEPGNVMDDGHNAGDDILAAAKALDWNADSFIIYPDQYLMNIVRNELNIPRQMIPFQLISIGSHSVPVPVHWSYLLANFFWP